MQYGARSHRRESPRCACLAHARRIAAAGPHSFSQVDIVPLSDRFQIATRLRGLIAATGVSDLAVAAERLGVEELALRISIDEDSPYPVFGVLAAAVAVYGVDPTWLVTGEYDPKVHRTAIDSGRHHALELITRMAGPGDRMRSESPSASEESPRC